MSGVANTALHITYHGARASQRAMYIVAIRNIRRETYKAVRLRGALLSNFSLARDLLSKQDFKLLSLGA